MGREPEIEPSSTMGDGTAGVQARQRAGRRWPKVTVLWLIVASSGLLAFAAGLFAVAHLISYYPAMYFYVPGDRGQPVLSAFPADGGLLCEQDPFFLTPCADVNVREFDPQLPAFANGQSFEVWCLRGNAIAIRVEGKQYTTPEFDWLAPLNAATPWALLLGFFGTVSATYRLVQRKALVMVPVLVLPILVALAWLQNPFFGSGC